MDIKEAIEITGEAISDSVDKVTATISPGLANLAETQIGKQIASVLTAAGAKAEEALEKSHLPEVTKPTLPQPAADLVSSAREAVHPSEHRSGSRKALIVGGTVLVAGATAAAGVVVYRRRKGAQSDDAGWTEEGEGAVVTPIPTSGDGSAAADSQQSDSSDDKESTMPDLTAEASFAAELDAEADHFVRDFVDHIDDEEGVVDLDYALELDAEADHFAQDFIDKVETTDEELPEEK